MIKKLAQPSHLQLAAAVIVAIVGVAITWRILAATVSVDLEAETSTATAPATVISDNAASGGKAVQFGGAATGGGGTGTGGTGNTGGGTGTTSQCESVTKTGGGTWSCTFDDEFSGSSLDSSKWEVLTDHLWGNACYVNSPENIFVGGGNLTLRATKSSSTVSCSGLSNNYATGAAQTMGKFSQKYGRFEMRAKLPAGQGMWPAFWLLPQDSPYGGWPVSGEIDVMEALGHQPSIAHATLHWGDSGGNDTGEGFECAVSPNYSDDYHTYTLEWAENSMAIYFDGTLCHDFTSWSSPLGFPKPFDQPFYMIVNLSVGGEWPGEPDGSTTFPGDFVIDYVRAWQ